MRKKGLLFLLFWSLGVMTEYGWAQTTRILDVRIVSGDNSHVQVVIDISQPVRYQLMLPSSSNTQQLFLDLYNSVALERIRYPMLQNHPLLRAVYKVNQDSQVTRLVLELNNSVQAKSFLLPPAGMMGHRLVIALEPSPGRQIIRNLSREANSAPNPKFAHSAGGKIATVHPPSPNKRETIIAVDAGHGGVDPGAIGKMGTQEKTVVLAIAQYLALRINRYPGMKAVMIRNGDYYLKLRERIERARQLQADLFISIHADANPQTTARGSSVYILSQRGASSEAAKWLAEQENAADLRGGDTMVKLDDKDEILASVLFDLSQTGTLESSAHLARSVLQSLSQIGPICHAKVQQAAFQVLRSPDIPSILVETSFLTNPIDEANLRKDAYRKKLADAIFDGMIEYLNNHSIYK